jgi:hypothetical protein
MYVHVHVNILPSLQVSHCFCNDSRLLCVFTRFTHIHISSYVYIVDIYYLTYTYSQGNLHTLSLGGSWQLHRTEVEEIRVCTCTYLEMYIISTYSAVIPKTVN